MRKYGQFRFFCKPSSYPPPSSPTSMIIRGRKTERPGSASAPNRALTLITNERRARGRFSAGYLPTICVPNSWTSRAAVFSTVGENERKGEKEGDVRVEMDRRNLDAQS